MGRVYGIILICITVSIGSMAQAGWAKTDQRAKVIAQSEVALHKQFKRVDVSNREDLVLAKDEKSEIVSDLHNRLTDAYLDLLYMAYKSPNRER